MMTLLGMKLALFAGLIAWRLSRDRIDWRPALGPPLHRMLLPPLAVLAAGVAAGFSAALGLLGLLVAAALLLAYPLGEWRLTPEAIVSRAGLSLRWDQVVALRAHRRFVELVARGGRRVWLPRDLDGMVTFARVAGQALPPALLKEPTVQRLLLQLEQGHAVGAPDPDFRR